MKESMHIVLDNLWEHKRLWRVANALALFSSLLHEKISFIWLTLAGERCILKRSLKSMAIKKQKNKTKTQQRDTWSHHALTERVSEIHCTRAKYLLSSFCTSTIDNAAGLTVEREREKNNNSRAQERSTASRSASTNVCEDIVPQRNSLV